MEYVLVWAEYRLHDTQYDRWNLPVLVIRKNKPEWQKGKLNLPGGKIEEGETPEQAAIRELKEEAGLEGKWPTIAGKIIGDWGTVYVVEVRLTDDEVQQPPEETEKVEWNSWISLKADPALMPNLRVIIPLLMTYSSDWVIHDEGPSWETDRHKFICEVNSWRKE